MIRQYRYGRWRLASHIALPELTELPPDTAPDILVETVEAVADIADPVRQTPFLTIARDGIALVTVDGVARYRLEAGARILVAPAPGAPAADVRLFLLGAVAGLVSHQRGGLPLHAASVAIGGQGVAFAGVSGAGKSTLAAACTRHGHALVADDISDVAFEGGCALVHRAAPRLRLWSQSLDALEVARDGLVQNRQGQDKFLLPTPGVGEASVPLAAVLLVTQSPTMQAEIEWVPGFAAFSLLLDQVYRREAAIAMGRGADLHWQIARLAGSVQVGLLHRPRDLSALATLPPLIEQALAERQSKLACSI